MNARRLGRELLIVLVLLLARSTSATAATTIMTLRDGRPVSGVEIQIVKSVSGSIVQTGRTGGGGRFVITDLEQDVLYQAQTADHRFWSEPFAVGGEISLEIGDPGWQPAMTASFGIGSSTSEFTGSDLDATEGSFSGGPIVGFSVFTPPQKLLVYGVRPFLGTTIEIPVIQPDEFEDSAGNTAVIEDQFRWRVGGGISIPVDIMEYELRIEPSAYYVLAQSELVVESIGGITLKDKFMNHSIQVGSAIALPIRQVGSAWIELNLGVYADIPISGSESNEVLRGEPEIDVRGHVGVRVRYSGLFNQDSVNRR